MRRYDDRAFTNHRSDVAGDARGGGAGTVAR
jgi:hypothetical protein